MLVPYVGTVYHFTFINPFNVFDGIYRVDQILTYNETVESGVDLQELYTDAGWTEEEFNNNINVLRADKILKLTNIKIPEIIKYMPSSLGRLEPDPNVNEYAQLALAINLGVYDNLEKVNFVKSTMESIVSKGLGVEESAYVFTMNNVWMTTDDYYEQEAKRAELKEGLINLYSENTRLRKELESALVKVNHYEKLLVRLNTATDTTTDTTE